MKLERIISLGLAVCMVFAFVGILYGVAYGIFRVAWGTVLIYPIAIIGAILLNMIFHIH